MTGIAFSVASRMTGTVSANPVIWVEGALVSPVAHRPKQKSKETHQMRPHLLLDTSVVHLALILAEPLKERHPRPAVRALVELDDGLEDEFGIVRWRDELSEGEDQREEG